MTVKPSSSTLQFSGLRVQRGGLTLAQADALAAQPGEFIAVIGPNGAGKSSLLKAVTGEWPSTGDVQILGRRLGDWRRAELACRMAVMPQSSALNFDFSVEEVVKLGRLPHRQTPPAVNRQRAEAAMTALGLERMRAQRFTQLSGGERQRVQFARVLAQIWGDPRARLLLLDEPTAALDLAQQKSVLDLALMQAREGATVIAVMHDLNLAARYADRVWVMRQGGVVLDGAPDAVFSTRMLDEVFGVQAYVERAASDGCAAILLRPDHAVVPAKDTFFPVVE